MTREPRQRWRLVVARDAAARDLVHRDVAAAWEAGLRASGLPLSMTEAAAPRPRITFAAPAPVGVLAERELIDIVLTDLILIHDVRAAVESGAPPGYRLVDLYDVWQAGPSLASLVTAGDYRVTVTTEVGAGGAPTGLDAAELDAAVGAVLAAPRIDHIRTKGEGEVTVDIRPHLIHVRRAARAGGGTTSATGTRGTTGSLAPIGSVELWMRLRLGGEGGVGRPEEVVAALGRQLGKRLVAGQVTRERIVLADDPDT